MKAELDYNVSFERGNGSTTSIELWATVDRFQMGSELKSLSVRRSRLVSTAHLDGAALIADPGILARAALDLAEPAAEAAIVALVQEAHAAGLVRATEVYAVVSRVAEYLKESRSNVAMMGLTERTAEYLGRVAATEGKGRAASLEAALEGLGLDFPGRDPRPTRSAVAEQFAGAFLRAFDAEAMFRGKSGQSSAGGPS